MEDGKDRLVRRQYAPEFKQEAVRLADAVGLNAAADRLGVPRATVGNWARRRRKPDVEPQATSAPLRLVQSGEKRTAAELEAEVARLRRELASQKLDNEILRKAAAYFARESR
jgi:transposase